MNKRFIAPLILLATVTANAQVDETPLSVKCKDGNSLYTTTAKVERIEIKSGNINVVPKAGESTVFAIKDVERIEMGELAVGINEVATQHQKFQLIVETDYIHINGAKPGTIVTLYDINGKVIAQTNCEADNTQLPVKQLNSGTYIIKAGSFVGKFIKR